MRDIDDILNFRGDISPFLVHLTRDTENGHSAHDVLRRIIDERRLIAGPSMISDGRFGTHTLSMEAKEQCRYFGAVCFTETPLNEVHCMLEIKYRRVNLKSHGLVFLKQQIKKRGVGPVFYLNNEMGDKDETVRALCDLIDAKADVAALVLPMLAVFGRYITAPGPNRRTEKLTLRGSVNGDYRACWDRSNFPIKMFLLGCALTKRLRNLKTLSGRSDLLIPHET
jgi:hypothetical protein